MKLRVNLLKDSERRYQGPVSVRFLLRAFGIGGASLLVLFVILALQQQFMLSRNLKAAEEDWARVGPRYEDLTKKQAVLNNYKGLVDELNQWGPTNATWHEMLLELGQLVPESVQLMSMNMNVTWSFVKPVVAPKPKVSAAGSPKPPGEKKPEPTPEQKKAEEDKKAADRLAKDVTTPARTLNISLQGRVAGGLADEVVVQFAKNLHKSHGYDVYFDTMELEKLYLEDTSGRTTNSLRLFEIQGASKARLMQ